MVQRRVEKGFRKNDFRDRWRSPKDGPAGASAEASKRGLRQGFGKVSKGSEGVLSGTRVRLRRRVFEGVSERVFRTGFRRGLSEVASKGGLPG